MLLTVEQLFDNLVRKSFTVFHQPQLNELECVPFYIIFSYSLTYAFFFFSFPEHSFLNVHKTEILQMRAEFMWGLLGGI